MTINASVIEGIAKAAVQVAAGLVDQVSPIGGVVLAWAGAVAFEIYDLEQGGGTPVQAAQLAGDRVADLVEKLKVGG
jgi:hypothetical protein